MALFDNPFDAAHRLSRGGCTCGEHTSQAAHEAALSGEAGIDRKSVV